MSHYALLDDNNIVLRVIVAEQDFVDKQPGRWVQTSYNTNAGVNRRGVAALRKNFAGVGYSYDAVRDAFIPPKPYSSWILNESTCQWDAPVPRPAIGSWRWNEAITGWEPA